jgi:phospholipid/cholesterol/gamma-HCH transport system ATP-binding protein
MSTPDSAPAHVSHGPLLRIVDVQKKLGRQKVLKGVNLEINQGERMVIIGRSGGGKSVLLKHIIGLMQPDAGAVWFRDQNLARLTEEQLVPLRRETGMLFQNGALFDSLSVGENVAFPLREKGFKDEKMIRAEVERALKIVDLPGQESKWPSELSGGMRKRVALARAAIAKPALMLYDEPTSGLDPVVADSINKLMVRLGKELEMTSIIVTHDMVSAKEVGDRIAFLHEGQIYCVDKPEAVLSSTDPIVHRFVNGISDLTDIVF